MAVATPGDNCRSGPPLEQGADITALRAWLKAKSKSSGWSDWKWQVRNSFNVAELAQCGVFDHDDAWQQVVARYPVAVTPYYLGLSDFADPDDPIKKQWLPQRAELVGEKGAEEDPFVEIGSTPVPGVVHRFPDRVLVVVSAHCAVRCRHCTRKNIFEEMPVVSGKAQLEAAVNYVRHHPGVREVILSGGDPMLNDDHVLLRQVAAFSSLPQLDAVRIGTRVPATLPMRITPELAQELGQSGKVWINTQFNHAVEITPEAAEACTLLVKAGIPLSNQSVLMAGVNDNIESLTALCCGLQRIRVRPYYIFIGDPVTGTGHFRVTAAKAAVLQAELARRVGGLALPRFVADIPEAAAKTDVRDLI